MMKSKTSTKYSYVTKIKIDHISNTVYGYDSERVPEFTYLNNGDLYDPDYEKKIVGGYLFFDGEYYGPILSAEKDQFAYFYTNITTADKLPEEMGGQYVKIYNKKSVTTTTYPPFYHKAKKGQSLYVKKNGAIGNEPDVYVKTGGTIKKLY